MDREVRVAVGLGDTAVEDNQYLVADQLHREDFYYPEVIPVFTGGGEDQVYRMWGLEDRAVVNVDELHTVGTLVCAFPDQHFEQLAGAHFLRCHVIRFFHSMVFAFLLAWGVICCK